MIPRLVMVPIIYPIPIFYILFPFSVTKAHSQWLKSHFPRAKTGQSQFPFYPFRTLCTALVAGTFRICDKVAVISFKAIHNLRPILNDVLAITCGVMWALFCMTQPLSSNALLGTDLLLQLFHRYGTVYRTILRKRMSLISLRDSSRRTILKRPIATCLELS